MFCYIRWTRPAGGTGYIHGTSACDSLDLVVCQSKCQVAPLVCNEDLPELVHGEGEAPDPGREWRVGFSVG